MAEKKYYAVKFKDGQTEIFRDWATCKSRILGVKGVIYKGFPTEIEALTFLNMDLGGATLGNGIGTNVAVYVDGSYRDEIYSYGFVVVDIKADKAVYEQRGRGDDAEAAKLRNVSGEMKGAMEAISYCLNSGIKEATICYDYSGIEMWALGVWKRNNIYTQGYHDFFQSRKDKIRIHFKKIKGHSGDKWNERADVLAKEGLEES